MKKTELMKYVGNIEQIGGIRDFIYNDGSAKGVRGIEVSTGELQFVILPDRGLDIANVYFKGSAVSWISKTGITAPQFYEKDGRNWMRGFFGGLMTTCGLHNIGRPSETEGLHGRISYIPAHNVSVFADWIDGEYIMKISGEMRDSIAMGYNLVLKRTITAKLFQNEIIVEDRIINEGFEPDKIALCYHCNFGYPLVKEGARIVNVPVESAEITKPCHHNKEEVIPIEYKEDYVTVGIENDDVGAYLTYKRETLPDFILWKMLGESDYVVGLEPRTTCYGGENIVKNNKFVKLNPSEEYKTMLKFNIKEI